MEREKKLYATLFLTSLLSGLPHSNSAKNFRRDGKYGVNYAHFVKNPFQRLNTAVLDSLIVSRTLECTYHCVNHQECYSVNYGVASLTCELLNANKFQNWTDVVHSEIWDHYNIKSPCISNPCKNGALFCRPNYNQDDSQCVCKPGYGGIFCETDIDECSSSPCDNEATCIDKVDGYICVCQPGYEGLHCETDINECSSDPCVNGGSCTDRVNSYVCACQPGFEGLRCETNINECLSSPCSNGAICVDQVNSYVCNCQAGFAGMHCETDINECSSNPCLNGGVCNDQVNGYGCACSAKYTGARCETKRFVNIFIRSEGCNDPGVPPNTCGIAYIRVDGTEYSPQNRGHNVVVVDGATGVFLAARAFDTHADSSSGNNLRDYLNSLSGNKIVLVAIQDSASEYMSPATDALKRLGATDPLQANYRDSFAFAGYAGVNKPQWITQKRADSYQGPSEIFPQIPLSVDQ